MIPPAALPARLHGIAHPTTLSPAGLGRRLGSALYESLLLCALLFIAGFLLLPLLSPAGAAGQALAIPPVPVRVMSFCLLFAVLALYCVGFWAGARRTLAMKTWRIRLTCRDGTPPDGRTALLRYLAAWIGPLAALLAYVPLHRAGLGVHALSLLLLNFAWALVDPDRQFLHDRLAGTLILADPEPDSSASPAAAPPDAKAPPPSR